MASMQCGNCEGQGVMQDGSSCPGCGGSGSHSVSPGSAFPLAHDGGAVIGASPFEEINYNAPGYGSGGAE
jgi:hypothetical protein